MNHRNHNQSLRRCPLDPAFTLLEVILVVAILVILSLVVIPHYTRAAPDDTREDILANNLLTIRAQLKMYQVQHLNEYPCGKILTPALPEEFVKRMTTRTNADHSADGVFGPYFRDFPVNPFNGLNTVRYGSEAGRGMAGWCFDLASGQIRSDDGEHSPDGTMHNAY